MYSDHHHHDHDHDHDHDNPHAPPQPDDKVHSYHQILSIALKELLIEKGVVTAAEVRQFIEKRDSITPANGAKVVARAWVDPAYRARLFEDGNAAAAELGMIAALRETLRIPTVRAITIDPVPDHNKRSAATSSTCSSDMPLLLQNR
mgnify:CR=1 FL=1